MFGVGTDSVDVADAEDTEGTNIDARGSRERWPSAGAELYDEATEGFRAWAVPLGGSKLEDAGFVPIGRVGCVAGAPNGA